MVTSNMPTAGFRGRPIEPVARHAGGGLAASPGGSIHRLRPGWRSAPVVAAAAILLLPALAGVGTRGAAPTVGQPGDFGQAWRTTSSIP